MRKRFIALLAVCTLCMAACGTSTESKEPENQDKVENNVSDEKENNETSDVKDTENSDEFEVDKEDNSSKADSDEPSNEDSFEVVVPDELNDWKNFTVAIDGETITIPCSYEKMAEFTGTEVKNSQNELQIEGGYYTVANMCINDKSALSLSVVNTSEETTAITECEVMEMAQTAYNVEQSSLIIMFPGGFHAGQIIDENVLIAKFGEPTKFYEHNSETSNRWTKTYRWCIDEEWTTSDYYEVVIKNGVIDELSLNYSGE